MKELKILHLYSDLLDLYGDYTNVTAVRRAAAQLGYESAVTEVQLGEPIDPAGYDFIYIGHGKARNLAAAAPHFRQYADAITAAVENGTVFLVTGNARFLFGGSFQTPDGEETGIGLFPYHGIETGKVFTGDVVSRPVFDESVRCYGFVNRTSHLTGENPYPLFKVLRGPGDGETPNGTEGTLPELLRHLADGPGTGAQSRPAAGGTPSHHRGGLLRAGSQPAGACAGDHLGRIRRPAVTRTIQQRTDAQHRRLSFLFGLVPGKTKISPRIFC